ncbi:MAG: YciI family protein [Acidimicrobiia bacterium]
MRFMLFMLPNIETGGGDFTPTAEAVAEMTKYNQELEKSGVLLEAEGLHSQEEGARVTHERGKVTVIDGPFTEAKEAIGGYWMIQAKSKEEAIEWAKRVPSVQGDPFTIEVRPVFDMEEFPPDVQAAAQRS